MESYSESYLCPATPEKILHGRSNWTEIPPLRLGNAVKHTLESGQKIKPATRGFEGTMAKLPERIPHNDLPP